MMTSRPVTPGRKNPLYLGLFSRLKRARKSAGLNVTDLSRNAGLAHNAVVGLESGGRVPKVDTVEKLARVLNVEACWLAYGIQGAAPFRQKVPGGAPQDGPPQVKDVPSGPLASDGLRARLRAVRTARGLSKKDLGTAANMTGQAVAYLEEGRSLPSVANAEALAVALEVSPCWLAFGQGEPPIQK